MLTTTELQTVIAGVETYGAACACGTGASPAETDRHLAYLRTVDEPRPWVCVACDTCADCGLVGHEPGTAGCPWEAA